MESAAPTRQQAEPDAPAELDLQARAVVLEQPGRLRLRTLPLTAPEAGDLVVDIAWSGISTGTERLLYDGAMPPFPGMGYPLVPGYESVGRVVTAAAETGYAPGDAVFVPGARCYGDVHGLFGGTASRVVVQADRIIRLPATLAGRPEGVLLALAATAQHALADGERLPQLVVGHGVLGRLLARLVIAAGGPPPVVWESNPARRDGALGYPVLAPGELPDGSAAFDCIVDASGSVAVFDDLIARLARGGELVLAGFYSAPVQFAFPPAFMREARLRVAAEWQYPDLEQVLIWLEQGRLSLGGLITHIYPASDAERAYPTAFTDADCLKMVLDWSETS